MSSVRADARAPAFYDLYSQGEVSADEVDDFIGRWHEDKEPWAKDLALHEYLGLSHEEYEVWLCDPGALPLILAARRSNTSLVDVMAEHFEEMRRANRPEGVTTLFPLGNWLKARSGR